MLNDVFKTVQGLSSVTPIEFNKLYTDKTNEAFLSSSKWYGATTDFEVWEKKSAKRGLYGYDVCISVEWINALGGYDYVTAQSNANKVVIKYEDKLVLSYRGDDFEGRLIDFINNVIAWVYVIRYVDNAQSVPEAIAG